jgi:hypothetical protein
LRWATVAVDLREGNFFLFARDVHQDQSIISAGGPVRGVARHLETDCDPSRHDENCLNGFGFYENGKDSTLPENCPFLSGVAGWWH